MTCSGVYKIQIGNFLYYGSSVNIEKRISMHLSQLKRGIHKNPKLQNAFNKYGTFNHSVVKHCSCKEMLDLEQSMIDSIWGKKHCANLRPVTNSPLGTKQSKILIQKRVNARAGYRHSEETKKKMTASQRKRNPTLSWGTVLKYMSAEEKAQLKARNKLKLSLKFKGVPRSEETKKKISQSNKGKIVTEDQKEKIRKTLTGYKHSFQTREKLRIARSGVPLSEKNKLGLSIAHSKSIVILMINNKEVRFASIMVAANAIGVKKATLRAWLRGLNPWPNNESKIKVSGLTGGRTEPKSKEVKP